MAIRLRGFSAKTLDAAKSAALSMAAPATQPLRARRPHCSRRLLSTSLLPDRALLLPSRDVPHPNVKKNVGDERWPRSGSGVGDRGPLGIVLGGRSAMEFARADGGALVCPVPPHPLPIRLKQKSSREEDALID